jgi:nucleoid-associated protein YgaU
MGALVKGEVDAVIYDFPFAANEIGDYNKKVVISAKNINEPSKPNEYVLGIPVGQGELLAKINEAIDEYKSTSDYAKMIQEYIPNPGKDSKEEEEDKKSKKDESEYYTVRSGETLSLIAKAHLGDMSKYREIYELNSDVLASADIVYTGQKLRKPKGWQ